VIGATGFIGRHLTAALRARGDVVTAASLRDPAAAAAAVAGCDAIVNLAGEPIAQRWSPEVKRKLESSRVDATRALINALAQHMPRPSAYVAASAVGYYGTSEAATFIESSDAGSDFLGQLCANWEREGNRAIELGMRVAHVRTGIALGTDGGALAKMLPPFRLGAGGVIGSGRQWMSWVHIDDVVGIYLFALDGASGIFNATAPAPVTNAAFTQALGRVLHRPTILPTPIFALKLMLGEGSVLLTEGQCVLPARTQEAGYRFRFTDLDAALNDLLA
jgi:uncharacterized protein (TIGR01777 family)